MDMEENFCTFCHTVVPQSELSDSLEEMLIVLFIEQTSDRAIACPCCIKKITEFCEFKLLCLIGEEELYQSKENENEALCNLFLKVYGSSRCRFCKSQLGLSEIKMIPHPLDQYGIRGLVKKHFCEMDIAETSSWMICKSCIEVLSDFKSFLNACEIIPRINLPTDKPNGLSDKLIISNATSEIVTGVFFECQYCGWKRTSKESYDRHIRFRHKDCLRASSNQDLIYKCYLCNIKKNHEVDLLQHIITKHIASKRPEIEKDKEISNSIGNQRKEQLFECYLCSERAASKSGLICHIRASHFRNRYHWTPQSRGKLKIDNINFSNAEQQADDENNTNGLCVKNNKHLEKVYSETRRNNQRGRKINLIKTTEQSKTVKTPKKNLHGKTIEIINVQFVDIPRI